MVVLILEVGTQSGSGSLLMHPDACNSASSSARILVQRTLRRAQASASLGSGLVSTSLRSSCSLVRHLASHPAFCLGLAFFLSFLMRFSNFKVSATRKGALPMKHVSSLRPLFFAMATAFSELAHCPAMARLFCHADQRT